MPVVIGIRFKDSGKTYFFDPRDLTLQAGDPVIVETVRGLELAKVAYERREVPASEIVGELKPVVRRAEPSDLERLRLLQSRHHEVLAKCAEKVREHSLPMSLVKAEYSFDGSRLTFYFTAEKRVDFRLLVRDLARTFKSRIELRQIGPRDEAKLIGGIGPCGRVLCCASFLPDYARVSIKMAKDQDLPLNPAKISGVCGRLLCCLAYEHEQYVDMRAQLPRKGTWVQTPDGPGEVVGQNVLKQQLIVQLVGSGMIETYDMAAVVVATADVAATARARNAEGITPAASRPRPPERDRGERRMLRDEIDQYGALEDLAAIEELDDTPRRKEAPPARSEPRRKDGPPGRPEQSARPVPPRNKEAPAARPEQSARPAPPARPEPRRKDAPAGRPEPASPRDTDAVRTDDQPSPGQAQARPVDPAGRRRRRRNKKPNEGGS
jgi:cell fate regulator YaaT (PSP1 superfamily)